ncbi:MAG: pyridoxal phosphate-dependent aminotransferase [Pseudomonadota bacterium]|nr:pyridoxal phosphate-dependent aminotransferase [Pseudomonadota bacterium]
MTQAAPLQPPTRTIRKSDKLADVCYDIRGPVLTAANQLEAEGHQILKLNIGNPAPWGFSAPEEILLDVVRNIPNSQGYSDSKGLFAARKAVMQYCQQINIRDVDVEDIYIGNGVSELVVLSMQALVNDGDEVLVPCPDFPLWSAAVNLCGGTPVHYLCDEEDEWQPDLEDIRSKITPNTRGIVVINPNNPTGAVYTPKMQQALINIAREHDLVVFADEIYDKILFDNERYIPLASYADDLLCMTFSGLSKSYRVAGFRAGWMVVSGARERASDFIEGLNILASMRLCSNVPSQHAIQTALGGHQSIFELTAPGGRLHEQRNLAWELLNKIDGVSCTKPKGALYLFPKLDTKRFNVRDDMQFVLDFLLAEKVLTVQGTGFHWPKPDHFRVVFLPHVEQIRESIGRLKRFLANYRQQ